MLVLLWLELDTVTNFVNNYHPSLKFTWAISEDQLPFLDLYLKPTSQGQVMRLMIKRSDEGEFQARGLKMASFFLIRNRPYSYYRY